jgi:fructose-bisphosphate aldolase, class II
MTLLSNLTPLLKDAKAAGYAVGSFNVFNMESLLGFIDAAVETQSPLVVAIAESHLPYLDLESFMPMALELARRAPMPVALHFDHARSLEIIERALHAGFSSVMYDGYQLPYETRVEETRLVVRLAHAIGVSVETELGHVGRLGGSEGVLESGELADPAVAHDFVQRTGVDVLAVAVGSTHSMTAPEAGLDLERLKQIAQSSDSYLSLHGGSGISVSHLRAAIGIGVSKVSVFTKLANTALTQARKYLDKHEDVNLPDMCLEIRGGFRTAVVEQIERLGSAGHA